MREKRLVPHFVADRPVSLRILAGLDVETHPVRFGLMLQACGSENFRRMASRFPCVDPAYCTVVHGRCPHGGTLAACERGRRLSALVTTIADSGVFTKGGSPLDYDALFSRYQSMGVERGIILDRLRDCEGTVESARVGIERYSAGEYSFRLVGVAQGRDPDEYARCYEALVKLGYTEIAVGGLLTKRANTARYAHSNREEIRAVVGRIRAEWDPPWLFVLGVYNPKRHGFLEDLGVDGADYKGWIFQYTPRHSDPVARHVDRVAQTQAFIEREILSRVSGRPARERAVHEIGRGLLPHVVVNGSRVYRNGGDGWSTPAGTARSS